MRLIGDLLHTCYMHKTFKLALRKLKNLLLKSVVSISLSLENQSTFRIESAENKIFPMIYLTGGRRKDNDSMNRKRVWLVKIVFFENTNE